MKPDTSVKLTERKPDIGVKLTHPSPNLSAAPQFPNLHPLLLNLAGPATKKTNNLSKNNTTSTDICS